MVRNSLEPDSDFWPDPDSINMDPKHYKCNFLNMIFATPIVVRRECGVQSVRITSRVTRLLCSAGTNKHVVVCRGPVLSIRI